MADVELDVELEDDASGPARSAAASLSKLEQEMKAMLSASRSASNSLTIVSTRMKAATVTTSSWLSELRASRGVVSSVSAKAASGFSTQFTWVQRLSNAYARFSAMHPTLTGNINRMRNAFRGLGTDISEGVMAYLPQVVTWLTRIGTVAVAAFAAATAAATAFFARAFIQAASLREEAILAFNALGQQFGDVKQLAIEMRQPLSDTVEVMKQLYTAGFDKAQAEQLYKQVQDMRALGKSAQQTREMLLAISQIKMKGRLQMEELQQQLAEKLPVADVIEQIGRDMGGKTADEVRKAISAGEISAEQGIAAIQKVMSKLAGGGAAGDLAKQFSTDTWTGQLTTLRSIWSTTMDDLVVQAGPVFDILKGYLKEFIAYLQSDDFSTLKENLGNAIEDSGPILINIADGIKEIATGFREVMATGGGEMLKEITRGFSEMGPVSDETKQALREFGALLAQLTILTAAWVVSQVRAVAWFVRMGTAVWGAYTAVREAVDAAIQSVIETIASLFGIGADGGTNLIGGLVSGIRGGIGAVTSAVSDIVGTVTAAFTNPLGIHSDSTLYEEYGRNITGGLKAGIESSLPNMSDIISKGSGLIIPQYSHPITSRSMENGDYVLPSQRGIAPSVSPADFRGMVPTAASSAPAPSRTTPTATVNLYVSGVGPDAATEWENIRPLVRREAEQAIRSAGAV